MLKKFRSPIMPVLQGANTDCGIACATMIVNCFGADTTLREMRRRYSASVRGTTLRQLVGIFDDCGLVSRPLRVGLQDLSKLQCPAILHWDFDHYVVLEKCAGKYAHVVDPKVGRRRLSLAQLSDHLTGVAIEVGSNAGAIRTIGGSRASLWGLFAGVAPQAARLLLVLTGATIVINALALAVPMLLKVTFDRVIPQHDPGLLAKATCALAVAALLQFAIQVLRAEGLVRFRRHLSAHLTDRTFASLMWNKAAFFEARTPAKVATQYRSIDGITATLSEVLISRLVDGVAICIGTGIAFFFSWKIGAAIVGLVIAYTLIVVATRREALSRLAESVHADAQANHYFYETVSSMQTVKAYSCEVSRIATWQNIRGVVERAAARSGAYRARIYSALDLATSFAWLAIVYVAVSGIIAKELSLGVFTALLSWVNFVIYRARDITQAVSEVISLEEHVNRVDDILSHDKEVFANQSSLASAMPGDLREAPLSLRDVSFRYDIHSSWVVESCSARFAPGRLTVIRGESGVGKTTLLKLILGLLTPTKGSVWLGETALDEVSARSVRQRCAAVFQNDTLFSGSIGDNIALFDVAPDEELVRRCAKLACIDEVIQGLPMKYDSLVSREGGAFSAGQLQRMLLARALYRQPALLVLDEFTSNLDEVLERRILQNLRNLGITIVTAAHRPGVIAFADEVLDICAGKVAPAMEAAVPALAS